MRNGKYLDNKRKYLELETGRILNNTRKYLELEMERILDEKLRVFIMRNWKALE